MDAGQGQTLSVSFAPDDTADFNGTTASAVINVAKGTQTLAFPQPADITYGTPLTGGNPPFSLGQLMATLATSGPAPAGALSFNPPSGTILSAGNGQVLTVAVAATNDYNPASATTTINVLPAPLTVTADNASKFAGQANPAFTAQFAGFVNGDGPVNLGGLLTFMTDASASSPPGQYPITPGGLTSANYAITYVNGTLSVTSTSTTSTSTAVTASPNPGTAGQPITFTATVTDTSGATIPTGTVDLMNGATTIGMGTLGSNGQATIMATLPQGSYSITAVYAGNSSFQTSTSPALPVTVNTPSPTPTPTSPTPTPTSPTPTPTPPPTFLGEQRMTVKVKKKKILEFVLNFSAALVPAVPATR